MDEEKIKDNTMVVVLINMVVLIGYTLFIRINSHNAYAIIPLAFVIFWHFFICFILGLAWKKFRRPLLLSSLAVVLIGFSTCAIAFNIR